LFICLTGIRNPDISIVVWSPDTDVLIILLSYAQRGTQTLLLDTGIGNERRIINIHELANIIGLDISIALPAFHSFTGSDCTSSFVMKGKIKPFKLLQNSLLLLPVFNRLGSNQMWSVMRIS